MAEIAPSAYRELIRPLVEGKRFLVALGPAAASHGAVSELRGFGSQPVLVLGQGRGTGELPAEQDASWIDVMPAEAPLELMESIRCYEAALGEPSEEVQAAIDRYDPDGSALVLVSHYSDTRSVHGRRTYAPRLAQWSRLEDKTVVDPIWSAVGIPHATSEVCEPEPNLLEHAFARIDQGAGCVLAGDSSEGFNGGASYLRHVTSGEQVREEYDFFRKHCQRVRVMPFLEGIPCSIHGVLFGDHVLTLRPVEMVVFRQPGSTRLVYCGCATSWDPPAADRKAMRATARLVGRHLRESVGYRGGFTVDGVLTTGGFLPTELNARAGVGFQLFVQAAPELPLNWIMHAVREGEEIDFQPVSLERAILSRADVRRRTFTHAVLEARRMRGPVEGQDPLFLRVEDGPVCVPVEDEAAADVTARLGPSSVGAFVSVLPRESALPVGRSAAPLVAAVLAAAEQRYGFDLGPLIPATDVRRGAAGA